jgi:L-fucose isomerase-like protein
MANKRKKTMGAIVGNRGFFPAHLAKTGRKEMARVLQQAGIDVVVLGPEQSKTFWEAGVEEISGLQKLLRHICENGFEHHVAASFSSVAYALHEAAARYLGWDMYAHAG